MEQIAEKAQRVAGDALKRSLNAIDFKAAATARYPGDEELPDIEQAAEFMLRLAATNMQRGAKFAEGLNEH